MGLIKWLQKRGAVGSVVRTIIKQYKFVQKNNPNLKKEEILEMIFENRYESVEPKFSERERYISALGNIKTYESVKNLSMAILNIEMNIESLNDKSQNNCEEIINEEIERLAPELK